MKNLNENDRETILDALEAYKKQAGADKQEAISSTYKKAITSFHGSKGSSKEGDAIEDFKQKNRTDAGLDN
jgi:hypothetical protein